MRWTPITLAALGAAAVVAAGCGSAEKKDTASSGAGGSSDTLRIPFLADMSVPDPDVFYDVEGNVVILSQYEGLLKYKAGGTDLEGNLASDWTVSDDGLTYTFTLRDGVTFHSGASMTCATVKAAFQRRLDVDQAPAYMLKDVKEMDCPDASTFVVTLKQKVAPFLHYMASSWGPKVIGPEAIKTNAGKDFGQKFLQTKGDGTGPFKLTSFERGTAYTLTRNDTYWGAKPSFKRIVISITPEMGTQRLQLEKGDLDAILHGFPAAELESLPDDVTVLKEDALLRLLLYVNKNKAPFDTLETREALGSTIDVDQLREQGYSDTATRSTGVFPPGILANEPPLPYAVNKDKAKAAANAAATKDITLAYSADESGVQRRVSELIQAQMKEAGWNVTIREVQLPTIYGYIENLEKAPDLLLMTNTPDAAHPDTWASILLRSDGGLNFLGAENKTIDAKLEKALSAPEDEANALYRSIAQDAIDDSSVLYLGDVKNVFVLRSSLTGIEQTPVYPWTIDMAKVKRAEG